MAVFTGSHGIANGVDAVLNAAAELRRCGRADIKLLLIGDGKLKPALHARAQAEGLDNVVFHPPVGKGKLAGLMAATDVGLQILANVPAFYYGTSPNKLSDYLASPGCLCSTTIPAGWRGSSAASGAAMPCRRKIQWPSPMPCAMPSITARNVSQWVPGRGYWP